MIPQDIAMQDLIQKYIRLVWKKRIIILTSAAIIALSWVIVYRVFLKKPPEFTATVLIKFDDSDYKSAVADVAKLQTQAKIQLLDTRSFLETVIDSLHLQLELDAPQLNRFNIFKNCMVSPEAITGTYEINKKKSEVFIYYENTRENIDRHLIKKNRIKPGDDYIFDTNGIWFVLDKSYLVDNDDLIFHCNVKRMARERLRAKMEKNLDRSATLLRLSFTYTNAEVAAKVVNTIAEWFIKKLFEQKTYRTTSVVNTLDGQLSAARIELDKSETELQHFRESNPQLLLSTTGTNLISDIAQGQTELDEIDRDLENIDKMVSETPGSGDENQNMSFLELMSYLKGKNIAGMQVYTDKLQNLFDEKNKLIAQAYSQDHPKIQKIEAEINNLKEEINRKVTEYVQNLDLKKKELTQGVQGSQRDLLRFPKKELVLAELVRDREVKQRIYSNILIRYNEAKLSDASLVPDAYIMEEAEIPIGDYNLIKRFGPYLLGPVLGLILSIGVLLVLELLNTTARYPDDIESRLNLPMLGILPVILDEREVPDDVDFKKTLDRKLITSDYAPGIAAENFRLIRTKLLLKKTQNYVYIISSLYPNEGKSLVSSNLAITFAQQKLPTVLIDCDLRRGVLHSSFNCSKKPGLADALLSSGELTPAILDKISQQTHVPNLYLIPAGVQIPNPSELLGSTRMQELHRLLQLRYKAVLYDSPPFEFIPDSLILNSFIHNMILVVRYGKSNLNKLSRKLEEYKNVKSNFTGIILNASADHYTKEFNYSYYQY